MAKLKLGIVLPVERSSATEFLAYGRAVHSGMTTNAETYPDPLVKLSALEDSINKLATADAVPKEKQNIESNRELEAAKTALLAQLASNANYVLLIANGDRVVAQLSGYMLTKETKSNHNPMALKIKNNKTGINPGTARIDLANRAGCAIYVVMIKGANETYSIIDAFNTMSLPLTKLPPGESALRIYGKKGNKVSPFLDVLVRAS